MVPVCLLSRFLSVFPRWCSGVSLFSQRSFSAYGCCFDLSRVSDFTPSKGKRLAGGPASRTQYLYWRSLPVHHRGFQKETKRTRTEHMGKAIYHNSKNAPPL